MYITIYASDLNAVGALELYAFYDPEVFTVTSSDTMSLVSGQQVAINTATPGEASFNMISATGVSGSGSIWEIALRVNSSAAAGSYDLTLAVGDAYDTSLAPIAFSASGCSITVNAPTVSKQTMSVYWSGSSYTTYYKGDSVTVNFATNNAYNLSSADFEIEYDETMLELVSISLGSKLTSATNAIYSINSDIPGYAKISYASTSAISGGISPIVSATFKIISDDNSSASVKMTASNIYNSNLEVINGSSATRSIYVGKRTVAPTLPKISVSTFDGTAESFDISISAPGSTELAAIDFEISFDATKINCLNAVCEAPGCFIVQNIDNENGKVKFSFICVDGISEDTELVKLTFSREGLAGGSVRLGVVGKNAVDANYDPLSFEYESVTLLCHVPGPHATCTAPQICTICAKVFEDPLGHDEIAHDAKAPTCSEVGWDAYVTCSRCDHTTYVQIDTLPHNSTYYEAKEPTCTEFGWDAYEICADCGYSSYQKIDAYGHRILVGGTVMADPLELANDTGYPFSYNESTGEYASTNKDHYSGSYFTITVLHDCSLTIKYRVSSENGWDKLIIRRNGYEIANISGSWSQQSKVLDLSAGDVVTISYTKDGSVHSGSDTGWFILEYDNVEVSSYVPAPAEEAEPTCTEAVVCHFCQTQVKEALGHDEISHAAQAPTCTEVGWDAYVTCSRCDYTTYAEIAALGHNEVAHAAQVPTCTAIGWGAYVTCSRCDHSTHEEIAALGHHEISHAAQVPTCTAIGWDAYVTCSRCDYSTYEEIRATGHTASNWIIDVEATYDTDGSKHKQCLVCQAVTEVSIVPMLSHSYISVVTAPTCTHQGYTTHTCNHCDSVYVDDYVPAIGHNFTTEWTIDSNATCTTDGSKSHHCSRCDEKTNVTIIEASGHSYGDWYESKSASCTEDGEKTRVCAVCHNAEREAIEKLGHAEVSHNAQSASCTQAGWLAYTTCSRCDYTTYAEVDALGHNDTNRDNLCDRCEALLTTQPDTDADGDSPSDGESENLSGGAIAGIVAGAASTVGIGGFSLFWFAIKKKSWADLLAIFKR